MVFSRPVCTQRASECSSMTMRHGKHSATVDPGARGHSLLQPQLRPHSLRATVAPYRGSFATPLSLPTRRPRLFRLLPSSSQPGQLLSQPPRDSPLYLSFFPCPPPCLSHSFSPLVVYPSAAMYLPGGTNYVNSRMYAVLPFREHGLGFSLCLRVEG